MAKQSKAMIWSLGDSPSYSQLSTKNKINWPVLLSGCDEQGRFRAEPVIYKGQVCSMIPEITVDDVPPLLAELEEHGMIVLYEINGVALGQVVRWWEYQRPTWAKRSKYPAPPGWVDRIHERKKDVEILEGWDEDGGFPNLEQAIGKVSLDQFSLDQYSEPIRIESASNGQPINIESTWKEILFNLQNLWMKSAVQQYMAGSELLEIADGYIRVRFNNEQNMGFVMKRKIRDLEAAAEAVLERPVEIRGEL